MSSPFVEKIVSHARRSVEDVQAVLARHNIVDSPAPPASRPLRLTKLMFSGEKRIHTDVEPFSFEWSPHVSGINVIASDKNFVGKSSIFQTMLWVLRGEPKSLTTTVQGWVQRVVAELQAGDRFVRVQYDIKDTMPHGSVDLLNTNGGIIHSLPFSSAEAFKSHMNSVMLDALDLEPIATSREVPSQHRTVMYSDGWATYTGAFLFDSDSNALIGEHTGTDLAQRLLQVFLGIPWATTLFQARAAKRVAESQVQARRRKLGQLGGQSLDKLEARLSEIQEQIANGTVREKALANLDEVRKKYERLVLEVSRLKAATTVVNAEVAAGTEELLAKRRAFLEIEEEMTASRFLGKLSPTCCPRCTRAFTAARLQNERTSGECSVCMTQVEQDTEIDYKALRTTTQKDIAKFEKTLAAVKGRSQELEQNFEKAREDLEITAEELAKLSAGSTAQEEQKLRLEAARLEGMLDAISKLVQTDTGEEEDLAVLAAATDIAKEEVELAARAVLERSGDLIRDLVKRLGMRDVERVVLKRNASLEVYKGGSQSTFTGLSPGERLRVRIATVIALLQASQQFGAGRHPGLLIIDSPAKEEMADANVEEMLEALAELAETVNVQLFVALRGTVRALQHFPEDRCLLAKGDATLW